jgi:hypothetical protein
MRNNTFEHKYLSGNIVRGDYWVDQLGDVVVCVGEDINDSSIQTFSLANGDDDIMNLMEEENDYYVFGGQDIAISNPEAEYQGNILKECL